MSHTIHTIYLLVGCFGGLGMLASLLGALSEGRADGFWTNMLVVSMVVCVADILFGLGAILVHLL